MINDIHYYDESAEYTDEFYKTERLALQNRYNDMIKKASECRTEYQEMREKTKYYLKIGIGLAMAYWLFYLPILTRLSGGANRVAKLGGYILIGYSSLYYLFLLRKIWDLLLEGESGIGKWFARETKYTSLTSLAEQYEKEAAEAEKMRKMMEEKIKP
ncbi:MAG: hypothetical protein II919_05245 [Lachnospiraceae bacterium]|nr:hypothetical protein [Lachnospiraceae bacterium]